MTEPQIVEGLVIRPGDTLLIRVPMQVSREHFDNLVTALREKIPDSIRICVIAAEQLAVIVMPDVLRSSSRPAPGFADAVAEATANPGRVGRS